MMYNNIINHSLGEGRPRQKKEMTFTTTLNKIREHGPCAPGWEALLRNLDKTKADDEPLTLLTILESNGFDDALWSCRAVEGHDRDFRLFGVWCARQVQHLLTGSRSLAVLDVAEKYAVGDATEDERAAALDAAWSAWHAERAAACNAAWDAAWDAALNAALNAAWAAALDAALDAAWAVTWDTALDTERNAARQHARNAQEARFRKMLADGAFIGSTHLEDKK